MHASKALCTLGGINCRRIGGFMYKSPPGRFQGPYCGWWGSRLRILITLLGLLRCLKELNRTARADPPYYITYKKSRGNCKVHNMRLRPPVHKMWFCIFLQEIHKIIFTCYSCFYKICEACKTSYSSQHEIERKPYSHFSQYLFREKPTQVSNRLWTPKKIEEAYRKSRLWISYFRFWLVRYM
jgi:hypothetical protein